MKKTILMPEQQRLLAGYAKEACDIEGGLVNKWTARGDAKTKKARGDDDDDDDEFGYPPWHELPGAL